MGKRIYNYRDPKRWEDCRDCTRSKKTGGPRGETGPIVPEKDVNKEDGDPQT